MERQPHPAVGFALELVNGKKTHPVFDTLLCHLLWIILYLWQTFSFAAETRSADTRGHECSDEHAVEFPDPGIGCACQFAGAFRAFRGDIGPATGDSIAERVVERPALQSGRRAHGVCDDGFHGWKAD